MDIAHIIVFVGSLVFLAHLFTAIFSRTKVPDVLLLILIGIFIGPIFGIASASSFGIVGPVFTTITLVFILFESGIQLRLDSLGRSLKGTLALTHLNFVATMGVVGSISWVLTPLNFLESYMLGAIVGGTSSAVVIPLVRQLSMHEGTRTILLLESALSDVLCIVFAMALLEAVKLGHLRVGLMTGHIISTFLLATLSGAIAALVWSIFLNKIRTIQNSIFTTPAFVFVVYGAVEMLGYSGAIASLAFGITLGNIERIRLPFIEKYIPLEPISLNETDKLFFSEIVFLLKTFFFIYIGLSIQFIDLQSIAFGLMLTLVIFVLRIPVVYVSMPKSTAIEDVSLSAVMVPKGLAAAVLASLPIQQGIAGGELIQNITFAILFFSIVLTSLLIFFLNKSDLSKCYGWMFSAFGIQHTSKDI